MKRYVRNKAKAVDLDITSLLDILVILLVFLLMSYNSSELTVDLVPGLELVLGKSQDLGKSHLLIQINAQRDVHVEGKKLGKLNNPKTLILMKEQFVEQVGKLKQKYPYEKEGDMYITPSGKKVDPRSFYGINFVFDKAMSFKEIKPILEGAGEAGLHQFKFIVRGLD